MSAKTANITTTTTQTANAAGTLFLEAGEKSRVNISDRGAVKGALELAKLVAAQSLQVGGQAFQIVDNANKVVSASNAAAIEQVAAAKTDAGQTERILKIGGITVAVIAGLYLAFKR